MSETKPKPKPKPNGIPCGNTIAIVGDPGTGKTTLLLTFLKYGKVADRVVTLEEGPSLQDGASVSRALKRFNRLIRPAATTSDQETTGQTNGLDRNSGHAGRRNASSGHPGLTRSGLEALTTHAGRPAGRDNDQGQTNRIFVCLESSFARVLQHNRALFEVGGNGASDGCCLVIDASAFLSGRLEDQMRFSGTKPGENRQPLDEQWSKPHELTLGGVSNDKPDKFGLYFDAGNNKGPVRIELLAGEPGGLLKPVDEKQHIRLLTPPIVDPGQRVRLLKDLLAAILHNPAWQGHPTLLAVDSLSALLSEIGGRDSGAKTDGRRLHILNLVRWLEEVGVTSFLAAEATMPDGTVNGQPVFLGRDERYLVSGIVQLDYHRYPSGDLVRYLRVLKMRGAAHDMRPHYYELGTSGLTWLEALFAEPEKNGG